MRCKAFVLVLGLLIVSSSCIYAQNKEKAFKQGVEATVTKKAPIKTGKVPATSPRVSAKVTSKVLGAAGVKAGVSAGATSVSGKAAGQAAVAGNARASAKVVNEAILQAAAAKNSAQKAAQDLLSPSAVKPRAAAVPQAKLAEGVKVAKARQPAQEAKEYVGGVSGVELIQDSFSAYLIQNPEHAKAMREIVSIVYEEYALSPTAWDIRLGVIDAVENEVSTLEGFPAPDLTMETVMQEAPEVMQAVSVLTFKEYINKHALQFPNYGKDQSLDVTIHHTWRRLFEDDLYQKEKEMLVNCYVDAVNTDTVEDILSETEEFIQTQGKFPGIDKLTMKPQELVPYLQAGGANKLSAEEIKEISLGMKAGIIVHAWPFTSGWEVTSQRTKNRILRLMGFKI